MGKYGQCAKTAVDLLRKKEATDPIAAWDKAAVVVFPDSITSRKKVCPKNAFLGLCEEGIIKGIKVGSYTRSLVNKKYAVDAVNLLKKNPLLIKNKQALWAMVEGNSGKKHNAQLDVVIALWDNGLIEAESL